MPFAEESCNHLRQSIVFLVCVSWSPWWCRGASEVVGGRRRAEKKGRGNAISLYCVNSTPCSCALHKVVQRREAVRAEAWHYCLGRGFGCRLLLPRNGATFLLLSEMLQKIEKHCSGPVLTTETESGLMWGFFFFFFSKHRPVWIQCPLEMQSRSTEQEPYSWGNDTSPFQNTSSPIKFTKGCE